MKIQILISKNSWANQYIDLIRKKFKKISKNILIFNNHKKLKNGSQIHTRKFQFNKIKNEFEIIDNMNGKGNHFAKMHLFIPQKYWDLTKDGETLIFSNDNEVFKMSTTWSSLIIDEGEVSSYFLNKEPAYKIILEQEYRDSISVTLALDYNKR